MSVSYVKQECPDCGEVRTFQEFNSFLGFITRCMECGYQWSEMGDPITEAPDPWDIINS